MNEKTVEQLARDERLAYAREWKAKNKDKVKKYNATYWAKKALAKQNSNGAV